MASTRLAEAVGYPGSSVAFAQLLSGMERDGLIVREVRGKRTYRITLTDGAAGAREARAARSAPAVVPGAGGHVEMTGDGSRLTPGDAEAAAGLGATGGFDYDELARRLLVQVVRRLAATPTDLEQTVAGLERQLATAWTRHGTLTAENVRLREQLLQAQHDLDLAREVKGKAAASDELSDAEVVLLEGLLTSERQTEGQESGAPAG